MIRSIKGIFHPGAGGSVIIENASGIGFSVHIPANSPLYKHAEGDEVTVHTSMIVKEDDISLYGFSDRENMELFELLITVNGVGAKAGMAIMSALSPSELRRAIAMSDAKAICTANGVGKKTAERIILELKEKVSAGFDGAAAEEESAFIPISDARSEAISALMALGYNRNEASVAVGKVKGEELTCEEYIKNALKNLF